MANQTIDNVIRNVDDSAISGLLNGEDIIIQNGGRLIINSDNAISQQSAVIGNITINSTTGGSILIDGRDVWWISFDASTGNVPTLGTLGVQNCIGGTSLATGEFLGIWNTFGSNTPLASGGAMPSTGFIKFRSKVGNFLDNEIITLPGGATITVNSSTGGKRGWIEVAGEEGSTINIPRLGSMQAIGDWYELGVALGIENETFQYFTSDQVPAIQVETGVGTGIYEWWLNVGSTRWSQNNRIAQDNRGKYFGCSNAGLVTFALRGGINNGQQLTNGVRLRVPNIHVSNRNSATSFTTSQRNATLGTRWDFTTTSSGDIDLEKVSGYWNLSLAQPYSVRLVDLSTEGISISECATKPVLNNVACSITLALDVAPITLASCFVGIDLIDCNTIKYEGENSDVGVTITDCSDVNILRGKYVSFGDNTVATLTGSVTSYAITMTRINNFTMEDVIGCGGQNGFRFTTCTNGIIINCTTFHNVSESVTRINAQYSFIIDTACNNILIDGYILPPYGLTMSLGIAQIINSYNCEVRNVGTPTSPLTMSSTQAVTFGGNGFGNKAQKIYITGTTSPVSTINNETQVIVRNVRGDLANTNLQFNALNMDLRSTAGSNITTGQTAVYGTHFYDTFTSSTTGRILFLGNEPTTSSSNKAYIESGNPRFSSTGLIQLQTLGDSFVWEMDYFAIGHTSLANISPTITAVNSANHDFEYQIDIGSGWSSWKTLNATNLSGESIPAYVNEFSRGGFKLKVRAICNTTSATNSITNIRIDTITDATEIQREHPLRTPSIEFTGTLSNSVLGCFSSGGFLAGSGSHNTDRTIAIVPWDSNYSITARLRKPGYSQIQTSITVDSDGISIPISQSNYDTILDTDPGALGITVTNHGNSPITWNSKDFSITIQTTNDSLTAEQIANYINYNTSLLATFNGFIGLAWHEMIISDGSSFQTSRGTLFGSLGETFKGVRVVRNDGTTSVPGFTQFQADDGTYYIPPSTLTISAPGLLSGSRVHLYNVTTDSEIENVVLGGVGYTYSEISGTNIDVGDVLRLRVTYVDGTNARLPASSQGTTTSTGLTFCITQEVDTVYEALAIDGSSVAEFSQDGANIQINIDDPDNETSIGRIYNWFQYNLTTENGIAQFFGGLTAIDLVNIRVNNSILDLTLDNVGSSPVRITGGRIFRSDGTRIIASTSGSIHIEYNPVYAIETITSGLTPEESATLQILDTLTEDSSGFRFTAKALEEAHSSSYDDTLLQNKIDDIQNKIDAVPINPLLTNDPRLNNLDDTISDKASQDSIFGIY